MTADTLDFGACLSRCVLMGPLREHPFELKGYLLRTNIIPHSVVGSLCDSNHTYPFADGSTATPDTPQKHTYDDHVGSSAVGTESFHGSSWKSDGHGASEAQVCFEPDA